MASSAPTLLTPELFERFQSAFEIVAPGARACFRPGLSESQIDAITEVLPGELSEELRIWWRLCDGYSPGDLAPTRYDIPEGLGYGNFAPASLEESLAIYRRTQSEVATHDGGAIDGLPLDNWLPIDSAGRMSVELSPSVRDVSPVVATDGWAASVYGERIAESFGETILWWIEALEGGHARWQPEVGWELDREKIRPELFEFGLT